MFLHFVLRSWTNTSSNEISTAYSMSQESALSLWILHSILHHTINSLQTQSVLHHPRAFCIRRNENGATHHNDKTQLSHAEWSNLTISLTLIDSLNWAYVAVWNAWSVHWRCPLRVLQRWRKWSIRCWDSSGACGGMIIVKKMMPKCLFIKILIWI